jgi:hypothetical protein
MVVIFDSSLLLFLARMIVGGASTTKALEILFES